MLRALLVLTLASAVTGQSTHGHALRGFKSSHTGMNFTQVRAGIKNSSETSCHMPGFEDFCGYWNSCKEPPHNLLRSGGRCLFGRMLSYGQNDSVAELGVRGSYARLSMLQGPDAVAKMSKHHCTKDGRGAAMLGVGWNNPDVEQTYTYIVFALPCPQGDSAGSSWTLHSAPIAASWYGVHQVVQVAYNNTFVFSAWQDLAKDYSFAGGGLGGPGYMNYGYGFLDRCQFGSWNSKACCAPNVTIPSWLAVVEAFNNNESNAATTERQYEDPAVYRAFLANALGLNEFFNGNGYTYDGCYGFYSALDSTEYFYPNKHPGRWSDPDDIVTVAEVTKEGSNGFVFTWGPMHLCSTAKTPCDYDDGTVISQPLCQRQFGKTAGRLVGHIFGGEELPC